MPLCKKSDCLDKTKFIKHESDYNTICRNHKEILRYPQNKILIISESDKDSCLKWIKVARKDAYQA